MWGQGVNYSKCQGQIPRGEGEHLKAADHSCQGYIGMASSCCPRCSSKENGFSMPRPLTRCLSATDPPVKENPYEDVELHGRCLGKKCVLTFPGSPTPSIPDTPTKVRATGGVVAGGWGREARVPAP